MDKMHQKTDKELQKMDKHLNTAYLSRMRVVSELMDKYIKSVNKTADKLISDVENAETFEEKQKAKQAYINFWKKQIKSREFKKLNEKIANELYITNQEATKYINSKLGVIYAMNFNYVGNSLHKKLSGYSFSDITGEEATNYADLEKNKIKKSKDKAWNKKNIVKSVIAGAIMLSAADKILNGAVTRTFTKNLNSARIHANDATTYAENRGRLDGMYRASDFGFDIMKEWEATLDNRTRDSHAEADGEQRGLEEAFSNGLQYPRDPNGELSEIINCRCTLRYVLPGITEKGGRSAREGLVTGSYKKSSSFVGTESVNIEEMTYKEWIQWRK